jgi:hypothetical protein
MEPPTEYKSLSIQDRKIFDLIENKKKCSYSYPFTLEEMMDEAGDIEEDYPILNYFTGDRAVKLEKIHAYLKDMYE